MALQRLYQAWVPSERRPKPAGDDLERITRILTKLREDVVCDPVLHLQVPHPQP
ncbi:hypothetical protein ABZ646_45315 [Streptomyces sp. NPDC007162]|uniref:hypothetical protein n=1 Tax=Streptomyces sp. NPDC007162 TaxID=3156917 RepID=UPI003401E48F